MLFEEGTRCKLLHCERARARESIDGGIEVFMMLYILLYFALPPRQHYYHFCEGEPLRLRNYFLPCYSAKTFA